MGIISRDVSKEIVRAKGHTNITSNHSTTFMITKDIDIGIRADCVIGVQSDKAVADIDNEVKHAIRSGASIKFILEVDDMKEVINGKGHPDLQLSDSNDMVIRKSEYKCGRTLMIKADKAATELSRDIINSLKDPEEKLKIIIEVNP